MTTKISVVDSQPWPFMITKEVRTTYNVKFFVKFCEFSKFDFIFTMVSY